MRRIAHVGEFLDRTNARRQWRQTPWLNQALILRNGSPGETANAKIESDHHSYQGLEQNVTGDGARPDN